MIRTPSWLRSSFHVLILQDPIWLCWDGYPLVVFQKMFCVARIPVLDSKISTALQGECRRGYSGSGSTGLRQGVYRPSDARLESAWNSSRVFFFDCIRMWSANLQTAETLWTSGPWFDPRKSPLGGGSRGMLAEQDKQSLYIWLCCLAETIQTSQTWLIQFHYVV